MAITCTWELHAHRHGTRLVVNCAIEVSNPDIGLVDYL
jgi:hypothetical protein